MRSPARESTRDRILDVALTLFSEHGFAGASLQQIADQLGVTKAALYYHFKSKDEILAELVDPARAELDALLDRYEHATCTPVMRRQFMGDYVDYLLAHRRLIAYLSRDLPTLSHPVFASGSARRTERLTEAIAGAQLSLEQQVRVTMALRGAGVVIAQYGDANPEQLREALLSAMRALLRKPPAARDTPRPATVGAPTG